MVFFSVSLSLSFRCFCFARFAYFGSGSGSVFTCSDHFADLGSGSDFAFFTRSGQLADFACCGLSNTDLRFWLGIGCHDLGSTGYLGVSFVDFARFSLGRFALRGARSSDSFTLGRSFAARFDFSRATFTRRGLTSLPFVGLHSFSGFDLHYSFADCRGRVGPDICGGFGPSPLRLGVVCRLRFGRLSWFGFGVVGDGSVVRCIRFAPSVPSQIFSLGCDPRALRVFAISRMLVVAAFGFFAALIARRFFVVHVCDRGVFTSAQL